MDKPIKVIKISDTEYHLLENRIFFLEDNIIYIEAIGEQTDEIAQVHYEHINSLTGTFTGKINYFIDVNNAGKGSPRARKIWQQIAEMETSGRTAVYGIHPVAKVMASFVIGLTANKNIRFFFEKEKALSWLKS